VKWTLAIIHNKIYFLLKYKTLIKVSKH